MSKSTSALRHRFDRIAGSKPVLAAGALAIAWLAGGLFGVPALLKWQLPQQVQRQLGATLTLGEVYFKHTRTLGAQTLPGRYEKIRLWFTMRDEPPKVQMLMRGKGKVSIRNLEVHEIKDAPPRPGFEH